jgi:hypothetical protein
MVSVLSLSASRSQVIVRQMEVRRVHLLRRQSLVADCSGTLADQGLSDRGLFAVEAQRLIQ